MALSPLEPGDIPEVMRIERLSGYDAFVGRWEATEHAAEMASPDARYFGVRDGRRLSGFIILQKFREPSVRLRRIAVDGVERGLGTAMLREVMDWVFETTLAEAFHLDVHVENSRALHVYEREGLTQEGLDDLHRLMSIPKARWALLRGR